MEGKMKVAVMNGIGKMGFTERDIPTPKDDEVLVKLDYVGICGSDLHYYESGAIGDYVVEPPFVLGHEPGGVVVEVGKDVKHLKVGDKVALEPGKTCGHCEFCKQGKYNLCPDVVFFATPPVDGVFQEYVAHEADLCFKLPENVSTLEGALIEPLAVSNAIIIGFNVRPDATAKATAEQEGVDLRLYRVIYQAIEDVEAAMKGMLDPVFEEKVIGHAEVRQIFKASGVGNIAGSYVLDGVFQRGCTVRISREGKQIFEGPLASLKRFKDDVKEVKAGYECGLVFEGFNDIQELDQVEAYIMVEVPR